MAARKPYTPTIDEMREAWIQFEYADSSGWVPAYAPERGAQEFERFLTAVRSGEAE